MSKLKVALLAAAFAAPVFVAAPAQARQGHMIRAMQHLKQAQAQLAMASHDKAGHRVKAMVLIKQAEAQVHQGMVAGRHHAKKK